MFNLVNCDVKEIKNEEKFILNNTKKFFELISNSTYITAPHAQLISFRLLSLQVTLPSQGEVAYLIAKFA
jgi:hypothetical protein